MPGIDIRLDEDGEVLVRGPGVMAGYRNLPEKTAETFDGDWLRTGDIGVLDDDGYLTIVDRKKELIINAAGKNMSPANIEAHVKTSSPLIGQAIAIGDGRPYNVALITLDPDFAPDLRPAARDRGRLARRRSPTTQTILAEVERGVEAANAKLARVEQIKKFKVLADRLAARRRRADPDHEAQAPTDRRQVRRRDRRAVRRLSATARPADGRRSRRP